MLLVNMRLAAALGAALIVVAAAIQSIDEEKSSKQTIKSTIDTGTRLFEQPASLDAKDAPSNETKDRPPEQPANKIINHDAAGIESDARGANGIRTSGHDSGKDDDAGGAPMGQASGLVAPSDWLAGQAALLSEDYNHWPPGPLDEPPGEQQMSDQALVGPQPASASQRPKCRLEPDTYLDYDDYKEFTCAMCYHIIPEVHYSAKLSKRQNSSKLFNETDGNAYSPTLDIDAIRATFIKVDNYVRWQQCCLNAVNCCHRHTGLLPTTTTTTTTKSGDKQISRLVDEKPRDRCHATWDGLACWPETLANSIAEQLCPGYIYYNGHQGICSNYARKWCQQNGTWFIRNGHEWTDFSNCSSIGIYTGRMITGVVWYLLSSLLVLPAWYVMDKMPSRGGSKRVRITINLLFWLFLNGMLSGVQKVGIITGLFMEVGGQLGEWPRPHGFAMGRSTTVAATTTTTTTTTISANGSASWPAAARQNRQIETELASYGHGTRLPVGVAIGAVQGLNLVGMNTDSGFGATQTGTPTNKPTDRSNNRRRGRRRRRWLATKASSSAARQVRKLRVPDEESWPALLLLVFGCWSISVTIRITRLLGYAWMFTGAVHLCTLLHYAPADPPAALTKYLMMLTGIIPLSIGVAYVIVRTIYEPSPLNLLFKGPYYYVTSNYESLDKLWAVELNCWIEPSESELIEGIPNYPNVVLILLNFILFIVTLIIMCRITRPGSTRSEMSALDYFKAAGTLVLLYGAHYGTMIYRPKIEGCVGEQVMYYLFLLVDGLQGVLVSYVFCYNLPEGRDELKKRWARNMPIWCPFTKSAGRDRDQVSDGSRGSGYKRASFSHRSSNSVSNGRHTGVELIDLNDYDYGQKMSPTNINMSNVKT